ncbi:MAG: phosphatase PAP2 family protein [Bacteroidia bacterium]|nr:phosphatase PAP2 family protein [Bacteroidia bacterium]
MLETLLQLDRDFFLILNRDLANPFLDWLAPILREQSTWYLQYLLVIGFWIKQYGKKAWIPVVGAALLIALSDQFSANLVKNTFQRIRPCNEPLLEGMVRHLISSCNGYSFISAHATNHFALAIFFSLLLPEKWFWRWPVLIFWASSIAFSQVYVGVHYPMDVIVGAWVGSLFGLAFGRYTRKFVSTNHE